MHARARVLAAAHQRSANGGSIRLVLDYLLWPWTDLGWWWIFQEMISDTETLVRPGRAPFGWRCVHQRRNPGSHDQIKIHPWYFSSVNWRISPVFGWLVWLERCHTLSHPSEERRCSLFLADWHDEFQQADVPTPAEALIWAFQTDRRQFNLLCQWKSAVWSNAHFPVTKWNLIFPFEERLLTDPPLPVEAKHRTFLKLIEMFFFHFRTRIRWAWISI